MKVWKSSILLFVGLAILVMSAVTVSAVTVTDDIDDVGHTDPNTGELLTVANEPNIDITSVSYTITGSEITLTMTVKGTIEDSDSLYSIHFGTWNETLGEMPIAMTPGSRYYMATYSNGLGWFSTFLIEPSDSPTFLPFGELTDPVSGNTFTATFEIADFDPTFEVWGSTLKSKSDVGTWIDFAVTYSGDDDTGDDDDDDVIISPNGDDTGGDGNGDEGGGTPGFEAIAVIAALAIALILLRRKKLCDDT